MTGQRTRNTVELKSNSENPKKAARIDSAQHERNEEIAALAYDLWHARGCPDGSPEHDWLQAERELQGRAVTVRPNPGHPAARLAEANRNVTARFTK
jgi:hypothetical protein